MQFSLYFYLYFSVGGSLKHFWNVFTGDLIDTIEMPANRGGVNSYFYDIFTDIWITREMVLDVARVIKENPRYKIYVIIYFIFSHSFKFDSKRSKNLGNWSFAGWGTCSYCRSTYSNGYYPESARTDPFTNSGPATNRRRKMGYLGWGSRSFIFIEQIFHFIIFCCI